MMTSDGPPSPTGKEPPLKPRSDSRAVTRMGTDDTISEAQMLTAAWKAASAAGLAWKPASKVIWNWAVGGPPNRAGPNCGRGRRAPGGAWAPVRTALRAGWASGEEVAACDGTWGTTTDTTRATAATGARAHRASRPRTGCLEPSSPMLLPLQSRPPVWRQTGEVPDRVYFLPQNQLTWEVAPPASVTDCDVGPFFVLAWHTRPGRLTDSVYVPARSLTEYVLLVVGVASAPPLNSTLHSHCSRLGQVELATTTAP